MYKTKQTKKSLSEDKNKKLQELIQAEFRINLRRLIKGELTDEECIDLVGCTEKKFKQHIESQFQPGMTWDNCVL